MTNFSLDIAKLNRLEPYPPIEYFYDQEKTQNTYLFCPFMLNASQLDICLTLQISLILNLLGSFIITLHFL